MSAVAGRGTSTTARAQSRERFVTWLIWPLGMITTSPSTVRRLVTRRVTLSTVPVTPEVAPRLEMRMRSPNPYWRSVMMKKPARMSCDDALRTEAEGNTGDRRGCDEAGDRDAESPSTCTPVTQ